MTSSSKQQSLPLKCCSESVPVYRKQYCRQTLHSVSDEEALADGGKGNKQKEANSKSSEKQEVIVRRN